MPNNRSQRHLIATPIEQLCSGRQRRIESEHECIRLKTQNDIYMETDKWQKELNGRLTSEPTKERAEALNDKEEPQNATVTSLVKAIASLVEKVEANSELVARSLSAYERANRLAKPRQKNLTGLSALSELQRWQSLALRLLRLQNCSKHLDRPRGWIRVQSQGGLNGCSS